MFTKPFSRYDVIAGDSISCTVDGTDYTATIRYDSHTTPYDFECYTPEQIKACKRGDWCFVGIEVTAERNGVNLCVFSDGSFASLWGIESNSRPDYLLEVANDLLRESIPEANEARKRIAKAMT